MANCGPFAFTPLVEPTSNVTHTPPPAPFDPVIAYLLGQCCSLTYAQFDAGLAWVPTFASLALSGYSITASNAVAFSVYEANEPGPTAGDVGDYAQVPAGFAVQLTLTPPRGSSPSFVVIALRGTRTWAEWFQDVDGIPTPFAATSEFSDGLGSVHAGFYGLYTMGANGQVVSAPLASSWTARAPGSVAYQVGQYVSQLAGLPIYVTGHSLGGALAALCALDIAYNFPGHFTGLAMYSLASPRVAAGISDSFGIPIPGLGNEQGFLLQYQRYVPNSYRIVHAADIVPILPPSSAALGPLSVNFAQITDPFQVGSGATATATINSAGQVASVIVENSKSHGYSSVFPPRVMFSGGGGNGAAAQASVSFFGNVGVSITDGGSGYTSAPAVAIVSSGSLQQNVVSFCAQTGDIGCNHGCINTYVPYLAQLAAGFAS